MLYVKSEGFQCLSPYGFCTQRQIKSLMSWVLWLLAARLCTLRSILLTILGFRVSDFYADVSPFPEAFYYKHTL